MERGFVHGAPRVAQHLCADNDGDGNPRRVYVGWDGRGAIVAVQDEGNSSQPEWSRADGVIYLGSVGITPGEYREWMRRIVNATGRFAVVDEEGDVRSRHDSRSAAQREARHMGRVFDFRTFRVVEIDENGNVR